MIVKNAKIVLKDKIINGYLEFDNNKIINIYQGKTNKDGHDAKGNYVLPAFFDSHTHGGYGYDFNMGVEPRSLQLSHYLKEVMFEGVASIMMTTVTCSQKDLKSLADNYLINKKLDDNNIIKGWYIEGPFISKDYKGAHNEKLIRKINLSELAYISKKLPTITKLLAIAPDFADNLTKLNKLNKQYHIAIGHTGANYACANKAFDLGCKRVVHLYNAMPDFAKREPTIINAIFNRNDILCELICDTKHVARETIENTYKIVGANNICIISDSLFTKGLKDGVYDLWNMKVDKKGDLDYLHNTNKMSGSNLPYHKQIELFGKITKCSMVDIVKVSSYNVAKYFKIENKIGNIVKNAQSSFVVLDKNYRLINTFINGILITKK